MTKYDQLELSRLSAPEGPLLLSTSPLWSQSGDYHEELNHRLRDAATTEVFAISYVTTFEGLRLAGILSPRARTRILVRPPDGLTRANAETLLSYRQQLPNLELRQLKAGADQNLAHLKVIRFRQNGKKLALVGSSNLTGAGLSKNIELNVLLDDSCPDFERLDALLERLWSDELSEPLQVTSFVNELIDADYRRVAHLLDFQCDILAQLSVAYEESKRGEGALMHLPTGTGKTVVAARFLLDQILHEPEVRVLWIAPQIELVVQAATTFAEQRPFFRFPQLAVEAASALRTREHKDLETDYNVIFRTLRTASDRAAGQSFDVVVVDEAHWGASDRGTMLNKLIKSLDVQFWLGLSATPFRRDAREHRVLRETFPRLVSPRAGHDPLHATDAAGRPVLAKVKHESHDTDISIALDPVTLTAFELSKTALSSFNDEERNDFIAETYDKRKHGQTLVFAFDTKHANDLARAFSEAHPELRLQVLHTGEIDEDLDLVVLPRDECFDDNARAEVYRQFRRGDIDVLIGVNLYVMGVDFPSIETLFMARPTLSPVLYAQTQVSPLCGPRFSRRRARRWLSDRLA